MNTSSFAKKNHSALVLVLVLLIAVLAFALLRNYNTERVSFGLDAEQTNITKGSQFTVDVSLKDKIEETVTAYELFIDYDKSKLQLVEAKHGGYFSDPMEVRWDLEQGQFSVAANPSGFKDSALKVDMNKPLLQLTFKGLDSVNKSEISISNESQIYISRKGALSPGSVEIKYSVQ